MHEKDLFGERGIYGELTRSAGCRASSDILEL